MAGGRARCQAQVPREVPAGLAKVPSSCASSRRPTTLGRSCHGCSHPLPDHTRSVVMAALPPCDLPPHTADPVLSSLLVTHDALRFHRVRVDPDPVLALAVQFADDV